MDNFVVENLGPIAKADVTFGDLTILTGPQASGKTLFLETFALVNDTLIILSDYYKSNNITDVNALLDYFYGGHLHKIIKTNTKIKYNGRIKDLHTEIMAANALLGNNIKEMKLHSNTEYNYSDVLYLNFFDYLLPKIVYIPAQRSSSISEGRIKSSDDFVNSPYVLIKFSNYLQQYVKRKASEMLKASKKDFDFLKKAEINMQRSSGSSRLEMTIDKRNIAYMSWSTGQREFVPLLMVLENFSTSKNKYIVIEEPELGLHPRAIIEFMFSVLKLMKRGVKVIISTHSSTPLDFVWAINHLKEKQADISNIADMFDFKIKDKSVFDNLAEKEIKVYYFSPDKKTRKVFSKDISSLDVYSEDEDVSNWGGMSLSADRAGSIVSKF